MILTPEQLDLILRWYGVAEFEGQAKEGDDKLYAELQRMSERRGPLVEGQIKDVIDNVVYVIDQIKDDPIAKDRYLSCIEALKLAQKQAYKADLAMIRVTEVI